MIIRTCTVNGRAGIIAAQDGKKDELPTRMLVLFDGDARESDAAWFPVAEVFIRSYRSTPAYQAAEAAYERNSSAANLAAYQAAGRAKMDEYLAHFDARHAVPA